MFRFLLTFSILACAHVSFGQHVIDSLKSLIKKESNTKDLNRIPYLQSLVGYHFSQAKEYDSALRWYYKAWTKHDEYNAAVAAETANAIAAIYNIKDYSDSARLYYEEALRLFDRARDTTSTSHVASNLAILFKDQGLYEKALDVSFEMLRKLEKGKPSRELGSCYSTIAAVYGNLRDYPHALEFHKKALHIRTALGLQRGIAQSYNNIGETYNSLHNSDSALANLTRALDIKRALGDPKSLPVTLNNIGVTYLAMGNVDAAENVFLEALSIKRTDEDRLGRVATLNNLGQVYILKRNFSKSLNYLNEAEKLVRDIGSLEYLAATLQLKINVLKATNSMAQAVRYFDELKIIRDSLLSKEKLEAMLTIEAQYESEKKEQEIDLLNQKNETAEARIAAREQWILSLSIGILLIIIIAGLIFYILRTTQRNKKHVETLLKELHHRVKNNLQILSSLFILQSQELTDEKAIEAVKTSESRVNAMALIHKRLYNADENRSINIKEYIEELVQSLALSYGYAQKNLRLDIEVEEIKVDVDRAIHLGLIINELVSNAFKHAFSQTTSPMLKINLKMADTRTLAIQLSDNGKGMSEDKSKPGSYGLGLVRMLTTSLKGTFTAVSDGGTSFQLKIPVHE